MQRATDVAREEIEHRMRQLKERLLALKPQRDDRSRGDVYADALLGVDEVEQSGQRHDQGVPQKTKHIGIGVSLRICRFEVLGLVVCRRTRTT